MYEALTTISGETRRFSSFDNSLYADFVSSIVLNDKIEYYKVVKSVLGKLNVPIIYDADIGHVSPQMAIVNGAILKITSRIDEYENYLNDIIIYFFLHISLTKHGKKKRQTTVFS